MADHRANAAKKRCDFVISYRTPPRGGGWGPDLSGLRDFGQIISGVSAKSAICSDFGQFLAP